MHLLVFPQPVWLPLSWMLSFSDIFRESNSYKVLHRLLQQARTKPLHQSYTGVTAQGGGVGWDRQKRHAKETHSRKRIQSRPAQKSLRVCSAVWRVAEAAWHIPQKHPGSRSPDLLMGRGCCEGFVLDTDACSLQTAVLSALQASAHLCCHIRDDLGPSTLPKGARH